MVFCIFISENSWTTTLVILSHHTNIFAAKFLSIIGGFAVNFSMSHFVVFRPLRTTNET
jgi:putative flippase GtrA